MSDMSARIAATQPLAVLGFMSGTSADGVDAAVLTTDGETITAQGPRLFTAYREDERAIIRSAMAAATGMTGASPLPPEVARAGEVVTRAHMRAGSQLLADHPEVALDLVGFHGQTVFHAPERGLTVQIGDAGALAGHLGVPVVDNMRTADVAAGGEGAPLAPAYHRALVEHAGITADGAIAVINIGGVSNATLIGTDGSLVAFDCGPGNALLDDFVRARTGQAMDVDGRIAAAGRVNQHLVDRWMADPWFDLPAPKSLDRNAFAAEGVAELSLEDGAATLVGFTSGTIVKGIVNAGGARRAVVVGGGTHNPTLLKKLSQDIGFEVETGESVDWDSDFLEAQAFAFLAVRSRRGLPLTFPGTTGVAEPLTGGRLRAA